MKSTQAQQQKEKSTLKNEHRSLGQHWVNKHSQYKGREKGIGNLFEEIMENVPHRGMETDIQVKGVQRIPNKMNPTRSTLWCRVIKRSKF